MAARTLSLSKARGFARSPKDYSESLICVRRPDGATRGLHSHFESQPGGLTQPHTTLSPAYSQLSPRGWFAWPPALSFSTVSEHPELLDGDGEGNSRTVYQPAVGGVAEIMALLPEWPRQTGTAPRAPVLCAAARAMPGGWGPAPVPSQRPSPDCLSPNAQHLRAPFHHRGASTCASTRGPDDDKLGHIRREATPVTSHSILGLSVVVCGAGPVSRI